MIKLAKEGLLFSGVISDDLLKEAAFSSYDVSIIERFVEANNLEDVSISFFFICQNSDSEGIEAKKIIQNKLGYPNPSEDDVTIFKYVCAMVSVRTALLIALSKSSSKKKSYSLQRLFAVISALIERIDRKNVKIAIDGSLYKKHPKIKQLLTDFITALTPGKKFDHFLAEDGSGKGAGLVVAALCRDGIDLICKK